MLSIHEIVRTIIPIVMCTQRCLDCLLASIHVACCLLRLVQAEACSGNIRVDLCCACNYIIVGSLSTLIESDYLLQLEERSLVPRPLPDFRQNLGAVWE